MTIFPLMAKSDKNLIQLYCKVVAAFYLTLQFILFFDVINNLCDTHLLYFCIIKMIPSFIFFLTKSIDSEIPSIKKN